LLKESIPLVILFRALGCVSDKAILSKICFDSPDDSEMSEVLRASLDEANIVDSEEEALDYIAKRGSAQAFIKENRISYTKLLLESELLPHVSTRPNDVQRKGFFLGYMVNKLLRAYLGRIQEDDRDYYGKKRLDMAGSLLAGHFRQLFR
jgi:DNA-directed RNA polymerase II subunit RPB2